MSNINKKSADVLYRDYQNQRDNIPVHTYLAISAAAEENCYEDSIHTIVQQAKLSASQKPAADAPSSSSFAKRLKAIIPGWVTAIPAPAFIGLVLVLALMPLTFRLGDHQIIYTEVAHLDGCVSCDLYIKNASIGTRGALPGLNRIEPNARFSARLGRILADLKVLVTLPESNAKPLIAMKIAEVRSLPNDFYGTRLAAEINNSKADTNSLIKAIEHDINANAYDSHLAAAQSIQIANITARRALSEGNVTSIKATLELAIRDYANLNDNTPIHSTVLTQLQAAESLDANDNSIRQLIKVYSLALKSLGV